MGRTIRDAVFELLLSYPETQEIETHGAPTFKVAGKTFAYWTLNHHGDGRVALWLSSPPGVQQDLLALKASAYFVPPYVGVKGWIGVALNRGLPWREISQRVHEAWVHAAPTRLHRAAPAIGKVSEPDTEMTAKDINPMLSDAAQAVLRGLEERCGKLPEAVPEAVGESATWRAGKRVFLRGQHDKGRLFLMFRVGVTQQSFMLEDPRYRLPRYYASGGWIELDVHDHVNWEEIEGLLLISYRGVALKRMLKTLETAPP